MLTKHLTQGQSAEIKTSNLQMIYEKNNISKIETSFNLQDISVGLPSFCDLLSSTGLNCENSIIIQKKMLLNMALTGLNGDNETHIGSSKSISYSLYDENRTEIAIKDQNKPIEYWIAKDPSLPIEQYTFIQASNASVKKNTTNLVYLNGAYVNGFKLSGSNVSVHVQIKPEKKNVGYLFLMKFGGNALANSSTKYFDKWSVFCPATDFIEENNESFFLFFMNMSKVNSYKGYIGYSITELNTTQFSMIDCLNKTNISALDTLISSLERPAANKSLFESNFWVRVYTSGCYFMDDNKWSSIGMEILKDTNLTHTHCQSNHLTSFAGGFVVLPNEINFENVWANADFSRNPVIYATCIVLVCSYVMLAVWAAYQDSQDEKKMSVVLLDHENNINQYIYEIIVLTGSRRNAGTDSKVSCIISSESTETEILKLTDANKKRKLFSRAGVDSFLLALNQPLGCLTSILIWHDNSGKVSSSWYLKYIIVHDLQTRDKSYFICEDWLGVERGASSIERVLPVCLQEQKTQFKYLLTKQTKQKLSDGHLWFSVLARPVQSSFSRLDRLTCCFVLLAVSMLMNILYYGMENQASKANGLQIGPYINLTPEQV